MNKNRNIQKSTSEETLNEHVNLHMSEHITLHLSTLSVSSVSVNRTAPTNTLPILKKSTLNAVNTTLPMEIWALILKKSDCLKKTRLLNKKFNNLSNDILMTIYAPLVDELSVNYSNSLASYNQLKSIKMPQLDHFKQFLLSPNTMENLNEIIWYTNAQVEVQSVCECLVRLFGAFPELDSTSRISWIDMRRILKRSDFKLWLANLAVNVEFIDIKDTKKVEQIIRVDPLITYERLREVSMAAYRLLILVAASLQHSTISHELDQANLDCKKVQKRLQNASQFLERL